MRGKLFLFSLLLTSIAGFSQVGIGTTLPNSSSQLEVSATNKGILIPRVALTSNSDATTITNGNVTSLLVYNTSTVAGATGVTPGFYYWSGSKWHQILNKDNIAALDATNDAFNNNTTTNVVELNTKSDGTTLRDANTEFVIQDIGNVGVGTATPNASALVDIMAANKGMLIPRVALTGLSDSSTITNGNVTSLLVYNTSTALDMVPGFYYWSAADTKWHQILNKDNIAALDATNDAFNNNTVRGAVELNTKSDGTSTRDAYTEFIILDAGNVGIGTSNPQNSALLDVNAPNKGVLFPRVHLTGLTDTSTISGGNQTSLLVYNLNTATGITPGYYYWDQGVWNRIVNENELNDAVDLRLVGADTHMTKDAGVGGTGTDQGTGSRNIFIGKETGFSNTAGNGNVFVGDRAGRANTTGASNYFIGRDAGMRNTTGFANLFMGRSAGYSNVSGVSNVFLGYRSGYVNSTGSYNLFLGSDAGYGNTTGYENIFLGRQSGRNNQTGRVNTFIGSNAGYQNTTGEFNNFLGAYAGQFNTEGFRNIFIGLSAGRNNTTASNNIFIGDAAGQNNGTNGHDNVFLGTRAGLNNNGDDNVFIGGNSGENNTDGRYGVFLGREAGYANTIGNRNVSVGHQAGRNITTGNSTVNIGYRAGMGDAGGATGNQNVNIGHEAGSRLSTGRDNVFIGYQSGRFATTTYRNTIVGNVAGSNLTTGINNTFYGSNAAQNATTAHHNAIFGYYSAARLTTGGHNAILGTSSGQLLTTAEGNTFVGNNSANNTTTGSTNTFIGREAANTNITGDENIAIGYRAAGFVNGSRNIVIGHRVSVNDGSNQLNIGNLIYGTGVNTGTGTTVSNGSIGIGTAAPKANAILDMSDVNSKGVYVPRVTLTGTTDITTVNISTTGAEASKSLLVYNTATVADVTEGYYYWNGAAIGGKWLKLIDESTFEDKSIFAVDPTNHLISNSVPTTNRPYFNRRNLSFVLGSNTLNDIPGVDDNKKMFFNRQKGAFRVGEVASTKWDDVNVGANSFGTGIETTASGMASFAGGFGTTSSGLGAFSFGFSTQSSGMASTAFGQSSFASGLASFTAGIFSTAESYGQATFGYHNTTQVGNATAAVATDRLFVIGNGTGPVKSDALTVLKNGNTTINGSLALNSTDGGFLMPKVALTGTADTATITAGNVEGLLVYNTATVSDVTPGFYSWNGTAWAAVGGSSSGGAFTTTANVTSNSSGTIATDDFVFGSTQLDDDLSTSDDERRMFFDKSKGAFRAGYAWTDQWDDANVGDYSVAIGHNGTASGISSVSLGASNRAFGGNAVGIGSNNIANGGYSVLLGSQNTSGTDWFSWALGSNNNLTSGNTVAIGTNNISSGRYSAALGTTLTSETHGQVSLGYHNTNVTGDAINPIATDRLLVVGNGTSAVKSDALTLLKNGNMTIAGSLTTAGATYPDYVFENYVDGKSAIDKTYTFKSLTEVEAFIKANKHLPGVTGINDLKKTKNGYQINLTKLSTQTLEKVEELYLHTIAQQKKIDTLKAENDALKARLSKIEAVLGIK